MNHRKKYIASSDYTYELPLEKIAQFPLDERDSSKLLVYKKGSIEDSFFKKLPELIEEDSLLIFNDTKVINARMFFDSGRSRPIEILLLNPFGKNKSIAKALNETGSSQWECIIGNMRKWKEKFLHKSVTVNVNTFDLSVHITERTESFFVLEFRWETDITFGDIIKHVGLTPLPPYMKRKVVEEDSIRYQTVYAEREGSVAAPTAGLHFTPKVIKQLEEKNILRANLTLHIGAGTFKPVQVENIFEHKMHSEIVTIKKELLTKLAEVPDSKTISIGTTSLRALESVYILGKKLLLGENEMIVNQWDGEIYCDSELHKEEILGALLNRTDKENSDELNFETSLMLYPGYKIFSGNGLITNFHQPGSTLLLLVAAFIGDDWKSVYEYALKNNYRFLSYGDSMLLFKNGSR